jgi:hypothetical protein
MPAMRLLPLAVFLFILPFPGTVALRLLALALGLALCAWTWHRNGFAQVPARTAILLWGGCALLSLATAIDPGYSLGEIKNEIGYAMAAYLCFITLTRSREAAALFVKALILGSAVLAAFALWEHFSSNLPRWNEGGIAGGSGSYSTYLLALLPALLWAGCVLTHRRRWLLVAGMIALQLLIAVLVGQRAFWLVFALQVMIALYLLRARGFFALSARQTWAIAAAAVILSSLAIAGATINRKSVPWTQDARVVSLGAVSARILEHPLAGKGFGRETMKKAYPDLISRDDPQYTNPHNLYLNYGLAMGMPGMIAILFVFYSLLRKFWELSRAEDRIVAMGGICGVLLVTGVFARSMANDLFQRDLALLFWSLAGMLFGYAQHARSASGRR